MYIFIFLEKLFFGIPRMIKRMLTLGYMNDFIKKNHIIIEKPYHIYGIPEMIISPSSEVKIGSHFTFRSGSHFSIDNFTSSKIIVHENARLTIGNHSGMSNVLVHCFESITIGDYVNIGAGCLIMDSNFHSLYWKDREDINVDKANARKSPVIIGDYVFVGARSIICKGVTIGARSMISAGSVVTQNIPSDELWGGNPAVFIKKINQQ